MSDHKSPEKPPIPQDREASDVSVLAEAVDPECQEELPADQLEIEQSLEKFLSFKISLYKELYEEQKKRREYISGKMQPMLTTLIALTPANIWIFKQWILKFLMPEENISALICLGLFLLSLTYLLGIFFFIKGFFFFNPSDRNLKKIQNIINSSNELLRADNEAGDIIIYRTKEKIIEDCMEITIDNQGKIDERAKLINFAFGAIGVNFIVCIVNFLILF